MEEMLHIQIPEQIENQQLPNPALLTFYKNLEHRILWLDSEVDDNWLEYAKYILAWNAEDKGKPQEERVPIKLFLFSPGGDLDTCNMLIDIIRLSETKVVALNTQLCMSAAAFIFLACHERVTLPRAQFLLHSGSADGISGTADQVAAYNAQYKKQVKQLKDYLVECGLPKKMVDSKMRGEWFIDASEAVDLGIAHRIVQSLDEVV